MSARSLTRMTKYILADTPSPGIPHTIYTPVDSLVTRGFFLSPLDVVHRSQAQPEHFQWRQCGEPVYVNSVVAYRVH